MAHTMAEDAGCAKCPSLAAGGFPLSLPLVLFTMPLSLQKRLSPPMAALFSSSHRTRSRLKVVLIILGAVVVLGAVGFAGFNILQSWRARDMAAKAMESFENGNNRMAWLQLNSARALRPDDPEVLRAAAIIESEFGMASGLLHWNQLAGQTSLSSADLEARARTAARFGGDNDFEKAVADLEEAGDVGAAGRLRAARLMARGDMDRAIEEAKRLAEAMDDAAMKLDVARLLYRRHVDRLTLQPQSELSQTLTREMADLVEAVQGTPVADNALAFALAMLPADDAQRQRWAETAMQNPAAENPAVLPAAGILVSLGATTPQEVYDNLRTSFDIAPVERRAAFSEWLTRNGLPHEALNIITQREAIASAEAFSARVEALAALENWSAVLEAVQTGGNIPRSTLLLAKARAEYALGRGQQSGAQSVADALQQSLHEGGFAAAGTTADAIGASAVVDQTLIDLCSDPRVADLAFRNARSRFSRRGPEGAALIDAAYERAKATAPGGSALGDYTRYRALIDDVAERGLTPVGNSPEELVVDPEETAAAVEAFPADEAIRCTHALALIQAGRGDESFAVFNDITIYFNRLPPQLQAILAAAAAASAEDGLAAAMAQRIDGNLLTPAEQKLLPAPAAP